MKNIINVARKELKKIFGNPRSFFSTIILPGLMIFVIYAFMGNSMGDINGGDTIHDIVIINEPVTFSEVFTDEALMTIKLKKIEYNEGETDEELKKLINDGTVSAVMVFEQNFDDKYEKSEKPFVKIFGDSSKLSSATVSSSLEILANEYLLFRQGVQKDRISIINEDIAKKGTSGSFMIGMLVPMLIVMFIFAGALGISADAIAGEKERGTLATLLMAPIKRSDIIFGKIVSTSIITISSALSSFIGIVASLPFAKDMFGGANISLGALEYLGILLVLFALALFAVTILLVASTFAKTVKEASAYAMPVYIVAMISGFMNMFSETIPSKLYIYLIPVYNCNQCLKGILTFDINAGQLFTTFASMLIYVLLLVALLIKMFKNERILFQR